MSSPSFENIDRWLFEYAEGNLSPHQVEQLEHFVFLHPELEVELDAWKDAKFNPSNTPIFDVTSVQKSFPLKSYLFAGSGLLALIAIFSWWMISNVQKEALYFSELIDAERIDLFDDEIEVVTSKTDVSRSVTHHDEIKNDALRVAENEVTLIRSNEEFAELIMADVKHSIFEERDAVNSRELASIEKDYSTDNSNELRYSEALEYENKSFISDYLDDVVLALSLPKSESVDVFADNANLIAADNKIKKMSSHKKSNAKPSKALQSRLNSATRKVKRMMDQPIALQNSKDPYINVPNMTGFQANFGMAGTLLRDRFQVTARNQWVGRDNQQLMNTVSWDGYVFPLRGGLGIDLAYSDYSDGSIRDIHSGFTYSPKFSVSKNVSIEPAIRYKMGVTNLDVNSPVVGNVAERHRNSLQPIFEDGQQPIGSRLYYRDLGAGVLMNTKWFYAGFNMDNLRRHYNNYFSSDVTQAHRADFHTSAMIGTEYSPLGKDVRYGSYIYYQSFGDLNEVWAGLNAQWKFLEISGSMSNNIDLSGAVGLRLNQWSVYYNMDYLTSRLYGEKFISHQVTMRFLLKPSRYVAQYLKK